MHTALVTLSNEAFRASRLRLVDSAHAWGISNVFSYDFDTLREEAFFSANQDIFSQARGMGFWLWKPFIIQKTLNALPENAILVYMDSGVEIIASLAPLFTICAESQPITLFGNGSDTNGRWTKRDSFVLMKCDSIAYWNGPHCDGSIIVFRKGDAATAFLDQWLAYCIQPAILTDLPNTCGLPNLSVFEDHRHDQSVLSLLAQQWRILLYRAPSQFGNHYKIYSERVEGEFNCPSQWDQTQVEYYHSIPYNNSFYGQLVNHHRTKLAPPPVDMSFRARLGRKLERLASSFR